MSDTQDSVRLETRGRVRVIRLCRPEVRNAIDGPTAAKLADAFIDFDQSTAYDVAVLAGDFGTFCAGADLKAVSGGAFGRGPDATVPVDPHDARAPLGPSYLRLGKPVIAAVAGYAVAGGLELALWCDLRVAEESATFGVFCRRWGVPLVDGGTVRLPRLIGHSQAMLGRNTMESGETVAGAGRFASGKGRGGTFEDI